MKSISKYHALHGFGALKLKADLDTVYRENTPPYPTVCQMDTAI